MSVARPNTMTVTLDFDADGNPTEKVTVSGASTMELIRQDDSKCMPAYVKLTGGVVLRVAGIDEARVLVSHLIDADWEDDIVEIGSDLPLYHDVSFKAEIHISHGTRSTVYFGDLHDACLWQAFVARKYRAAADAILSGE